MIGERFTRHLVLPSVAPAILIGLYFTPKTVFGCANRGYMALAVVFISLIAAVGTALKAELARRRGETEAVKWWIATTLVLVLPLILLVGPLG